MRKTNPNWHSYNKNKGWLLASNPKHNVFLEIIQKNNVFELKTWDGKVIGMFSNLTDAQNCASLFRTPLLGDYQVTDIRLVAEENLLIPKPKKQEKITMTPIVQDNTVLEFTPINEDDEIVVEHPDDVIAF